MTTDADFGAFERNGTVALTNNSTHFTAAGGTLLYRVRQGDHLEANGKQQTIDSVNVGAGTGELMIAWTGATGTYPALFMLDAVTRYDPAYTQESLLELVAQLQGSNQWVFVVGAAPDPALGKEGMWALKVNDGSYRVWYYTGGAWTSQPTLGGAVTAGAGLTLAGSSLSITNTITAGGPVGGSSVVPQITFNSRGQLTAVASVAITPAAIGAQPTDADLTALAAVTDTDKIIYRSAANTWGPVVIGTGLTFTGGTLKSYREVVSANRTYYVRDDGNDANNGLVNSAAGAFITVNAAWRLIRDTLHIKAGVVVTIKLIKAAAGVFAVPVVIEGPWDGAGYVLLEGDTANPANTVISVAGTGISVGTNNERSACLRISGLKIVATGTGIQAAERSSVSIVGPMEYGTCGVAHLGASRNAGIAILGQNYTISGGAANHILLANSLITDAGNTITLVGAPNFSDAFINLQRVSSANVAALTFVGGATGVRIRLSGGSGVETGGAISAALDNYFPGNQPGVNGGGYIR